MPDVKAANLLRVLQRLPSFCGQIGMALDAKLIAYSRQGLMVASVLPVTGHTVRGERFSRLMYQTSMTRGAGVR